MTLFAEGAFPFQYVDSFWDLHRTGFYNQFPRVGNTGE